MLLQIRIKDQLILNIYPICPYRGGVLEPEGTVEIKFRMKDLSKAMHRLDPVCISLKERMASPEMSRTERTQLEREMKAREQALRPIYHEVAVLFADLHDKPGRMQEKGVIMVSRQTFLFIYIYTEMTLFLFFQDFPCHMSLKHTFLYFIVSGLFNFFAEMSFFLSFFQDFLLFKYSNLI